MYHCAYHWDRLVVHQRGNIMDTITATVTIIGIAWMIRNHYREKAAYEARKRAAEAHAAEQALRITMIAEATAAGDMEAAEQLTIDWAIANKFGPTL